MLQLSKRVSCCFKFEKKKKVQGDDNEDGVNWDTIENMLRQRGRVEEGLSLIDIGMQKIFGVPSKSVNIQEALGECQEDDKSQEVHGRY